MEFHLGVQRLIYPLENKYDLSINRYKKIVYEEEYDEPEVIIENIRGLEKKRMDSLDKLDKLVK